MRGRGWGEGAATQMVIRERKAKTEKEIEKNKERKRARAARESLDGPTRQSGNSLIPDHKNPRPQKDTRIYRQRRDRIVANGKGVTCWIVVRLPRLSATRVTTAVLSCLLIWSVTREFSFRHQF